MANLGIEFCGVKFKNPTVLASGILGITGSSLANVVKNGAGGVTTKSVWLEPHKGHPGPIITATENYMLNAVGLPDGGIEKAKEEIAQYRKLTDAPLIGNIVAYSLENFEELTAKITEFKPDILEVNISCPNVESEFGTPFACVAGDAARVTKEVKKALKKVAPKLPVTVKLSPNVENIVEIAKAVVDAGADGLTVMNTVGPGMAINIESRTPILANRVGGLSGPSLKPLAVKFIYSIRQALPEIPIIGTGGVLTGEDAIEMMMAGATLVGIGTGVYYRGVEVFGLAAAEMNAWCTANKVKKLSSLIGTVK